MENGCGPNKIEVKEEPEDLPSAHVLENIPNISEIKIEPEWSQIKIEPFSGNHQERRETTLNVDTNIKCLLGYSNQIFDTVFDMPEILSPEQIEKSVKAENEETALKSERRQEIVFVHIKDEEIDEKINVNGTNFEHNEFISSSGDYGDLCVFEANCKGGLNKHPQYNNCEEVKVCRCNYKKIDKNYLKTSCHQNGEEISLSKFDHCEYQTLQKSNLKEEGNGTLICNLCDYGTVNKSHFKLHYLLKHKEVNDSNKLKCDQCAYVTLRKRDLKSHILLRHKNINEIDESYKFTCEQCSYVTFRKGDLKKHVVARHKNINEIETFKCIHCEFKTVYKRSMATHILRHKNIEEVDDSNKFKCDQCTYVTFRKRDLKTHILLRHKNIDEIDASHKFECDQCAYVTLRRGDLRRHILLRHKNLEVDDSNKFKCDQCAYVTLLKGDYKRHILLRHKNIDEIETFNCNQCDYRARRRNYLTQHLLKHKIT